MTKERVDRTSPTIRLPFHTVSSYALGSVGTAGFSTLPGLVLVYYLTDAHAVPAALAGFVVAVSKIWDVAVNPYIGYLSDRDRDRTGSRRRVMLIGALALPLFFILTFAVPGALGSTGAALWVLVAFLIAGTAFGAFQVPYIALPAELTSSYDERTRLLAWRVAAMAFGILLFGAGGPALRGPSNSLGGYLLMAVVCAVVIGGGMCVAVRTAPPRPRRQLSAGSGMAAWRGAWRNAFDVLRGSQPFRALLATFMLQAIATGLMLAGANYVATYVLHSSAAITILFAALIAPAIACMPVWTKLASRWGKERAFVVASALFTVAALSMTPLVYAAGGWIYLPTAVAGVAYAGMQALPLAMLPDVIGHDAARRLDDRGGTFSGVWTAGETTGMALGAQLLALILAVAGYRSSEAGQHLTQSAQTVDAIAISFSVVPAILVAISVVTLLRYRLRRSDLESLGQRKPS